MEKKFNSTYEISLYYENEKIKLKNSFDEQKGFLDTEYKQKRRDREDRWNNLKQSFKSEQRRDCDDYNNRYKRLCMNFRDASVHLELERQKEYAVLKDRLDKESKNITE